MKPDTFIRLRAAASEQVVAKTAAPNQSSKVIA
jgi:hypothetical protein